MAPPHAPPAAPAPTQMAVAAAPPQGPQQWIVSKRAEVETKYKAWIAKQPPHVEVWRGRAGADTGAVMSREGAGHVPPLTRRGRGVGGRQELGRGLNYRRRCPRGVGPALKPGMYAPVLQPALFSILTASLLRRPRRSPSPAWAARCRAAPLAPCWPRSPTPRVRRARDRARPRSLRLKPPPPL